MKELMALEFKGNRILITQQLAEAYETSIDNIKKNFSRNKERFEEGKHYYLLQGKELQDFKNKVTDSHLVGKNANQLYLWTERGADRHCKILDTDKAWEQFDNLESTYFKTKNNQLQLNNDMSKQIAEIVQAKIDEIENKCSNYYRPTALNKTQIATYIKGRLGINKTNNEYALVKKRILIILNARKWEDVPIEKMQNSMSVIDECIDIIKKDRPFIQQSMFN